MLCNSFLCIHFYSEQKYQAFNIINAKIIKILLHCLSYNKVNFNTMRKIVDIRSPFIHCLVSCDRSVDSSVVI